jgi:chlorite dismutase
MQPPAQDLDLREHGRGDIASDRRLFIHLLAWTDCDDVDALGPTLADTGLDAVVYRDVTDPRGVAIAVATQQPEAFVTTLRPVLAADPWPSLTPRPELTMIGRSYSLGYEPDLDDTLIHRPLRHLLTPDWPWALWYPLRRSGKFNALPPAEQSTILREHGQIGFAFGRAGVAHDIRLACHGLDRHDNDFVIGLMGPELAPLSKLVEAMRKTQQTSLYLESLGPFFVGHAAWRSGHV